MARAACGDGRVGAAIARRRLYCGCTIRHEREQGKRIRRGRFMDRWDTPIPGTSWGAASASLLQAPPQLRQRRFVHSQPSLEDQAVLSYLNQVLQRRKEMQDSIVKLSEVREQKRRE